MVYFIVERGPTVTKFVGQHPVVGGKIYDSDNMPFKASIGSTKVPKKELELLSSKYPEIRVLSEKEAKHVSGITEAIGEGKIKETDSWTSLFYDYKKYLEDKGTPLQEESPKKEEKTGE